MPNRSELDQMLCDSIVTALVSDLNMFGKASLLVSGGSTPKNLFQLLSNAPLNWKNISISLVDDRFLADNHKDQNGSMVKDLLIQNKATEANFIPLVQDINNIENNTLLITEKFKDIQQPFSALVLGMGGDGHTASLFPDCDELNEGMDLNNKNTFIQTNPKSAPYQRISLTRSAILNSKSLFLHFYGEEKQLVFEKAKNNKTYLPFPIQGFIHQDKSELKVFQAK